jgi:hypothetical protein
LTASITSAAISAHRSSVRIGSSGALRIEQCHTVNGGALRATYKH